MQPASLSPGPLLSRTRPHIRYGTAGPVGRAKAANRSPMPPALSPAPRNEGGRRRDGRTAPAAEGRGPARMPSCPAGKGL
ncbi:hypothetical protein GCM10009605_40910 [Nocardiopsis composta]